MNSIKKNSNLSVFIWFLIGIIGYAALVAVQQFVLGLTDTSIISKVVVVGQYTCIILSLYVLAFNFGKLLPSLLAVVMMFMQALIALIFMMPNWLGKVGLIELFNYLTHPAARGKVGLKDLMYYVGDTSLQYFPYLAIALIFGLICRFIPKYSSSIMKIALFGISGLVASGISLYFSMVMFQIQQMQFEMLLFNVFPFIVAFAVYALYIFTIGGSDEVYEGEEEFTELDSDEIDELLAIDGELDEETDKEISDKTDNK